MNSPGRCRGFTLVELVVVLVIFALLLSFSFPAFNNFHLFGRSRGQAGKLARLMQAQKQNAVAPGTDIRLCLDITGNRAWIAGNAPAAASDTPRDESGAVKTVWHFDESFSITGIEFDTPVRPADDTVVLRFSKQAVSDFALIRCIEKDTPLTLKLEPFLFTVRILDGHQSFERCSPQ